jgi:hypothetical protein
MLDRLTSELPVTVVLVVLWLAGAALMGTCGLALYYLWILVEAVAGITA